MDAATIRIRAASPNDAPALSALGVRTFRDTFAADNTPEDLAAHIAATYAPERQAAELADPARDTLVAETTNGDLVAFAHLLAGPAPACVRGPAPIELLRLYVDRPWHGRGLAHRLMTATLEVAARRKAETLWLGVWEHNPRAIAYYAKWGFHDVGSHEFVLGNDRQTDRIMVRPVEGGTPRGG